jgi:hypothetical protein
MAEIIAPRACCTVSLHKPNQEAEARAASPLLRRVVRSTVEPPTFRFSELRIAVQNWPYTSLSLLSGLRLPPMNLDTRACMRLEMRLDAVGSQVLRCHPA